MLLGGALAYCVMHQLWFAAAGVVIVGAVVSWLGYKSMKKT
jgi:hypothetical protein